MLYILIILIGILYALSYILPTKGVITNIYGDAYYGKEKIISVNNTGYVVDGRKRLQPAESYTHSLTLSPTGGGKTVTSILPNIITLASDEAPKSLIVNDVKSELIELTGAYLQSKGYEILELDFKNPATSARWNPLVNLKNDSMIKGFTSDLFELDNEKASDSVQGIWKNGSCEILLVLIHVLKRLPNQEKTTLDTLIALLNEMSKEEMPKLDKLVEKYASPRIKATYKSIRTREKKIYFGQLSSAQSACSLYATPAIRAVTSANTIDFSTFRKKKVAIFIKYPIKLSNEFNAIISLFLTQFFNYLLSTPLEKNDNPVYFLLDEFGNMKIPNFSKVCTLIRSQKCSLNIILQSIQQLDEKYSRSGAEIILGNLSTLLVIKGLRSKRDLEYISGLIGSTTRSHYTMGSFGLQFYNAKLITEGELRALGRKSLFLHGDKAPQRISTTPIFKNKKLMEQAGLLSIDKQLVPINKYEPNANPPTNEKNDATDITEMEELELKNISVTEQPDPEIEAYRKKLADILN